MVKTLMLSLFIISFWGCDAQFTMTQPPFVSASSGETVKISCTRSSGSISSYYNSWYQQKLGSAPVLLIYYDDDRASGISDRFSGSLDRSANAAVLTISNVQAEDEADYFCSSYDSSNKYIFGGGTQLTVSGQQPLPPNVNLFPPSAEERESKNKATLVCLVDGFHPPAITVTWEADGTTVSTGVETTKPTKLNDKYVASSYLTLSPSDWESHERYTCKVRHEGSDYVKSVSHSTCP